MSEQKHTAEQWGPIGGDHVGLASGLRLAKFWMESDRDLAITCVNAMQGIDDPAAAMAKCREALGAVCDNWDEVTKPGAAGEGCDDPSEVALCREALAAIGGAK